MAQESTLLIVEDSPDDYEACVTALTEESNLANPIEWCKTGEVALDYLYGTGDYADVGGKTPGLILLDLNLPGRSGHEVLQEIKGDERLKRIPVIVMTSSSDPADIDACYANGANSYVVKPVDLDGFMKAIARLREYWFQIVVLPKV